MSALMRAISVRRLSLATEIMLLDAGACASIQACRVRSQMSRNTQHSFDVTRLIRCLRSLRSWCGSIRLPKALIDFVNVVGGRCQQGLTEHVVDVGFGFCRHAPRFGVIGWRNQLGNGQNLFCRSCHRQQSPEHRDVGTGPRAALAPDLRAASGRHPERSMP